MRDWDKIYGSPALKVLIRGSQVIFDHSNNYWTIGDQDSSGCGTTLFIRKYDSSGNKLFDLRHGPHMPGTYTIGHIKEDHSDNIIVLMEESFPLSIDISVMKLDSLGNIIWHHSYDISNNSEDTPLDFCIDSINNIYILGNRYVTGVGNSYLLKIDPNGTFLWSKYQGPTYVNGAFIKSLSNIQLITATCLPGDSSMTIAHLDSSGNTINSNTYSYTGSARGIKFNDSGGTIMAGMNQSGDSTELKKIEYNGNIAWRVAMHIYYDMRNLNIIGENTHVLIYHQGFLILKKYDQFGNEVWSDSTAAPSITGVPQIEYSLDSNIYLIYNPYSFLKIRLYNSSGSFIRSLDCINDTFASPVDADIDANGNIVTLLSQGGGHESTVYFSDSLLVDTFSNQIPNYQKSWDYAYKIAKDNQNNILAFSVMSDSTFTYINGLNKYDQNGNLLWSTRIDSGKIRYLNNIKTDPFRNIYLYNNNINWDKKAYIYKLNASGQRVWTFEWIDSLGAYSHRYSIHDVEFDNQGNIYACGNMESNGMMGMIFKLDSMGNMLWQSRFNSTSLYDYSAWDIELTPDRVFCTYGTNYFDTIHIAEFDFNGNQIRTISTLGNISGKKSCQQFAIDSENNIELVGLTRDSVNATNCYLIKIDTLGNCIWDKLIPDFFLYPDHAFHDLNFVNPNNNIYLAGMTSGNSFVVMRIDRNGNTKWIDSLTAHSSANGIDFDQNLIYTIGKQNNQGWGSCSFSPNVEGYTIVYDSLGNRVFTDTIGIEPTHGFLSDIVHTNYGFYVCGSVYNDSTSDDVFIRKYSNLLLTIPDTKKFESIHDLVVIPNPATNRAMVHMNDYTLDIADIRIMDMSGKLFDVPMTYSKDNWFEMNLEKLPGGVYLITTRGKKGASATKLVKY